MARKLEEIEADIKGLTSEQQRQFREWYLEFDAANWEKQIEQDALDGRLDSLAEKALEDHKLNKTRRL